MSEYNTANFKWSEFSCKCCGRNETDISHIKRMQVLREEINRPILITSGYRCPKHNDAVGGRKNSMHLIGIASDISVENYAYSELYNLIKTAIVLGFRGIGIGKTFVHLDTRKTPPKMWVY